MTATEQCVELRDALTEVALGVADGTTRGVVMAHLATCERCRDDLATLAATADELLLLVPEREPSAGFESRVLARLAPERELRSSAGADQPAAEPVPPVTVRRQRVRRAVLAPALGVGLLGIGGAGVWVATEPDRDLAASYRTTLDTADGRYLAAADLMTGTGPGSSARSVGTVFLYEGNPSWAYVVVRGAGAAPAYEVAVTVDAGAGAGSDAGGYPDRAGSGGAGPAGPGASPGTDRTAGTREIALGSCVVVAQECSAGGVLDVAVRDVVSVRLTTPDGTTWATATPDPARP
ncbi:zf-HC2 domain-containing protein [Promicromonospora vindobonensis]|uniref:Zf-HC2 domain-containing protein n=1 Tax=Promicromonospora vindobonensis TaxID=195748 RepID=A0ABW5VL15_9MICO